VTGLRELTEILLTSSAKSRCVLDKHALSA
jgi:hypothetical protein